MSVEIAVSLSRTKNINNYIYKNSLKSIKLLIKQSSIKLLWKIGIT
jgi:hypothetical protein